MISTALQLLTDWHSSGQDSAVAAMPMNQVMISSRVLVSAEAGGGEIVLHLDRSLGLGWGWPWLDLDHGTATLGIEGQGWGLRLIIQQLATSSNPGKPAPQPEGG